MWIVKATFYRRTNTIEARFDDLNHAKQSFEYCAYLAATRRGGLITLSWNDDIRLMKEVA